MEYYDYELFLYLPKRLRIEIVLLFTSTCLYILANKVLWHYSFQPAAFLFSVLYINVNLNSLYNVLSKESYQNCSSTIPNPTVFSSHDRSSVDAVVYLVILYIYITFINSVQLYCQTQYLLNYAQKFSARN